MSYVYWKGPNGSQTAPTSGLYEVGSNWSSGQVPGGNDYLIFAAGTYTVRQATNTPSVNSLWLQKGVTLRASAAFQVSYDATIDGKLVLTSSTFSGGFLEGSGLVEGTGTISSFIGGPRTGPGIIPTPLEIRAVGGTITIDSPSPFNSQIGGALSGSGTIDLHSGGIVLDQGTRLSAANLTLSGAKVMLTTSLTYAGNFSLTGGMLNLYYGPTGQHGSLVLTGHDIFGAGTIFGGDPLYLKGASTFVGGTSVAETRLINSGHATAFGNLTLGNVTTGITTQSTGDFLNTAAGVYEFDQDSSILAGPGSDHNSMVNAGLVVKNGGGGTSLIDVAYTNTGKTQVSSGTVELGQAVTGKGVFAIDNDTTLRFDAAVGSAQQVIFGNGGNGTLALEAPGSFHGTVAGFVAGDTFDLGGFAASTARTTYTASADGTGGTLVVRSGADRVSLNLDGQFIASGFHVGTDSSGTGTAVTYTPPAQQKVASLAAAHV